MKTQIRAGSKSLSEQQGESYTGDITLLSQISEKFHCIDQIHPKYEVFNFVKSQNRES